MESTGEYWKPVYNILEGAFELWVVNARHYKNVPGHKTDPKDAAWLAELLRHGLVKPSFIPPRPQRDLRDLTRQRANLVAERADVVNRLQKVLEGANIKLTCVATDVTGVSARAMLAALIEGKADPATMAELACGRMRQKREALTEALSGFVRDHHRFLLSTHLTHIDFLDEQIETFNAQIEAQLGQMSQPPEPPSNAQGGSQTQSEPPPPTPLSPEELVPPAASYEKAIKSLVDLPGIAQRGAQAILAEIGTDMSRFPSDGHLTSWAGVCPGNHQSGGKRYSGKTNPGNAALRKALVQAAAGAMRAKDNSFRALYERLVRRRGKQRALVAVARKLLVVIYHLLKYQRPYKELGADYFDSHKREQVTNRLVQRLSKLGYYVTLETCQKAPSAA
jgi:transposase